MEILQYFILGICAIGLYFVVHSLYHACEEYAMDRVHK